MSKQTISRYSTSPVSHNIKNKNIYWPGGSLDFIDKSTDVTSMMQQDNTVQNHAAPLTEAAKQEMLSMAPQASPVDSLNWNNEGKGVAKPKGSIGGISLSQGLGMAGSLMNSFASSNNSLDSGKVDQMKNETIDNMTNASKLTDFDSIMQQEASMARLGKVDYKDFLGKYGAGDVIKSGVSGAVAGASGGPVVAALSAAANIGASLFGRNKAKKKAIKAAAAENERRQYVNNYNDRTITNSTDNAVSNQLSNLASNWAAFGGQLSTHGADWDNNFTYIGNGGSHESNPNEGVQMGLDPQGVPNLVEEGEVVYNDYVFSNRLRANKTLLDSVKLPVKYKNKTFADIAKNLAKEAEERPNDPISKNGLESSMQKLTEIQEQKRAEKQEREMQAQMMENPQMMQDPSQMMSLTEALMQESQQMPQEEMMMQEQIPQFAHGGKLGKNNKYAWGDWLLNNSTVQSAIQGLNQSPESNEDALAAIDIAAINGNPNYIKNLARTIIPSRFSLGDSEIQPKPKFTQDLFNVNHDYRLSGRQYPKGYKKIVPPKDDGTDKNPLFKAEDLRYAPVVGSALSLAYNMATKPDYNTSDTLSKVATDLANYDTITPTKLGNYLTYKPMDRLAAVNQLNATAAATRRALGNNAAAILAADNNYIRQQGDLFEKAEQFNRGEETRVATYNKDTDKFNATTQMQADMANTQARQAALARYADVQTKALAMRDAIGARRASSINANLSNLFDSLGNIGIDTINRQDRDRYIRTVAGRLSERPSGWSNKKWDEYNKDMDNLYSKYLNRAAYGGKVNKKRKGLTY